MVLNFSAHCQKLVVNGFCGISLGFKLIVNDNVKSSQQVIMGFWYDYNFCGIALNFSAHFVKWVGDYGFCRMSLGLELIVVDVKSGS